MYIQCEQWISMWCRNKLIFTVSTYCVDIDTMILVSYLSESLVHLFFYFWTGSGLLYVSLNLDSFKWSKGPTVSVETSMTLPVSSSVVRKLGHVLLGWFGKVWNGADICKTQSLDFLQILPILTSGGNASPPLSPIHLCLLQMVIPFLLMWCSWQKWLFHMIAHGESITGEPASRVICILLNCHLEFKMVYQ